MTIAIIGSGAVGCYFGARLVQAGYEVVFLARGERLHALRSDGLRLVGQEQTETAIAVNAVATLAGLDALTGALFCVKTWQVQPIARDMLALGIRPEWVLTTQNGVEAAGEIADCFGKEAALASVIHGFFEMTAPSTVRHVGVNPRIEFGAPYSSSTAQAEAVAQILKAADIEHQLSTDILSRLWEKLMLVSTIGTIGALARQPIGVCRENKALRAHMQKLMEEIHAVGIAQGADLPAALPGRIFAFIDQFPVEATSSMQRDLMAGYPSEIEAQLGVIVRLGEVTGVDVPFARMCYDFLTA